jgi:transcriptional regulator with XRE-family HTH domain
MDTREQDRKLLALELLARAEDQRVCAVSERDMLVHAARHRGASWAEVAERLGVSRQAAHQMFSMNASPDASTADLEAGEARRVARAARQEELEFRATYPTIAALEDRWRAEAAGQPPE